MPDTNIPSNDTEFSQMVTQLITAATPNPDKFGMTADDVSQIATAHGAFAAAPRRARAGAPSFADRHACQTPRASISRRTFAPLPARSLTEILPAGKSCLPFLFEMPARRAFGFMGDPLVRRDVSFCVCFGAPAPKTAL